MPLRSLWGASQGLRVPQGFARPRAAYNLLKFKGFCASTVPGSDFSRFSVQTVDLYLSERLQSMGTQNSSWNFLLPEIVKTHLLLQQFLARRQIIRNIAKQQIEARASFFRRINQRRLARNIHRLSRIFHRAFEIRNLIHQFQRGACSPVQTFPFAMARMSSSFACLPSATA